MTDSPTPTVALYLPSIGESPWNAPVNSNFSATDSLFGNVAAITLTNSNVTLIGPPAQGTSWLGPYQSQSALIRLNGTITANCQVIVPRAGFFIFENLCTSGANNTPAGMPGTFSVSVVGPNGGNIIGIPPNKKCHVFYDGTNMDYVNMPEPGTAYDLHGVTAMPTWMTACTVLPYLIKDGTNYTITQYPALYGVIGTAFGGTAGLNFNVPDELNRARIAFDTGNAATTSNPRLTSAVSGIAGRTMGSPGGDQRLSQHNHGITDNGHTHGPGTGTLNFYGSQAPGGALIPLTVNVAPQQATSSATSTANAKTGITNTNNAGGGVSANVQPSIVSFLPLLKT